MNLENVNQKVDQLGADMRQFMQHMSNLGPPGPFASGQSWTQQMATGTCNGMPYTLPAPVAMSTDLGEQRDLGRMARGSAGVAELVAIMEQQPWISVESFEAFAKRKAGVFFEGQPWSVAKLAKEHVAQMQGHRTLQKPS